MTSLVEAFISEGKIGLDIQRSNNVKKPLKLELITKTWLVTSVMGIDISPTCAASSKTFMCSLISRFLWPYSQLSDVSYSVDQSNTFGHRLFQRY